MTSTSIRKTVENYHKAFKKAGLNTTDMERLLSKGKQLACRQWKGSRSNPITSPTGQRVQENGNDLRTTERGTLPRNNIYVEASSQTYL